ncbi:DUF6065 family protein [Sneathiella sp.]|jgi:hypothetical protein|uniref:DUF6065 family protein n=1 Tax=Sneathiella sp. TaxID=1964365 RepID=UPI0039E2C2BD
MPLKQAENHIDPAPLTAPDQIIKFFRLIPDCPSPQRADRSAGGLIPTRAFRFCEPMTSASAFGWYVFAPMDFHVLWDGSDIYWQYGDTDDWYLLNAAQYPDFEHQFNQHCPEEVRGYCPPFLSAAPEPGVLKIWSGLIAQTAPDWSLLVRAPANLPGSQNYEHFEGIIETDRWFGPLFTNLRLTTTDVPILIKREMPLFQVQPLMRQTYDERALKNFELVSSLSDIEDADWRSFQQTVIDPGDAFDRKRGHYATEVRKARKNR